ncbi:MAG: hypothetical protein ACJ779_06740 [Chloroflexota bacterium]
MTALIGVVTLLIPVVGLAAFALAAMRWGVDSRPETSDPRARDRPVGIS